MSVSFPAVYLNKLKDLFALKSHTHSGYASSSHTHTKSQITDFGSYAASNHTHSEYAASNHTHTVSQITNIGCYVAECGTTNFSIKTLTAVDTYVTKTFTGIYKKWNNGIYELYGVVPDKTVPQGVNSYHHTLLFPTGISFAHCPNENNNDTTKFMYTFVGIEAFDENVATYQQYPLLLDTQYADSLLFSLMYLSDASNSSGFTFSLIGKLAN